MKTLLLAAALLAPSLAIGDELATETTQKRKKIYFRAGVAHIAPLEQSNEMELADVDGAASLALQNGPIAGSGATVTSATIPGIIVGYVLPWGGDKLSVETILGLPFTVTFQATGTLANESLAPTALGLPTGVGPLGPDLGEAKAVPIVLTAVYQVAQLGKVTPYVGAGPSIMFATEEKVTNMQLLEVGTPQMKIAPSPGLVLQAGLDAKLTNRIYARIDLKFIALMKARATVEHVQVRTPDLPLFDSVEVGTAKMSMWLNPLVVQAGIGTDF
jgi:outer membrane protein W